MAISYYQDGKLYLGLSTDDKTSISVQEGAKIYYTDTNKTQICHGGSWFDFNTPVSIVGSLANHATNQAITAGNNILATNYIAVSNQKSVLQIATNTSGVLSIVRDGVTLTINGGNTLTPGTLYAFELLLINGLAYNLQFSSNATLQIDWVGGV